MKIRIKFAKEGSMKFIGHLDIMRYFQKALRRAGVDIRYSEGFSPHPVMSFAAPLGVGLTSRGEYMDIEVLTTQDSRAMEERLNQVMAEGMKVLSYRRLPEDAKNAMSIVAAADYTLQFRPGYEPADPDGWKNALETFYNQETIIITKKTKKGQKEMDLKPLIYQLSVSGGDVFMRLSTGSADNIKPELVMDAFYQNFTQYRRGAEPEAPAESGAGERERSFSYMAFQIQREEVYADLGGEGSHDFRPLEQMGEVIG